MLISDNSFAITLTFILAIVGYVGLTVTVVLTARSRLPIGFWKMVAVVIAAHVVMVWVFRYGGDVSLAVRNGYAGFLIFHLAAVLILISTMVRHNIARRLIYLSFLVVTVGAIGASFKYDVVSMYRIPVVLCAMVGGFSLVRPGSVRW